MPKKIFLIIICLVLFLMVPLSSVSVHAEGYDINFSAKTPTLLLVNLDTNSVVYSKNADQKRYPASTTKIMTYIVVSEHVPDLENTMVTVKKSVIDELNGTDSSMAGLDKIEGKKISVLNLLNCLLICSGNDAAMTLADYVGGGSIQKFVDMMNAKAKQLGCTNTHFANPHGLQNSNHYTTARDLMKISQYAITLPHFSEICNTTAKDIPNIGTIITTNYMINQNSGADQDYYYQYAKGIKTGSTNEAGKCLVSMAVADGYSYMCVAMGAPDTDNTPNYAMLDSRSLYRWAFQNFQLKQVLTQSSPVCEVPLDLAWNDQDVQLVPEKDYFTILPNNVQISSIDIKTNIPDKILAPVRQGDVIGTATLSYANQKLATINLVAAKTVERSQVLYALSIIKAIVSSPFFIVAVTIIILLFIAYFILALVYRKRIDAQSKVNIYDVSSHKNNRNRF
ncbi:MAG: D-alanyl-D-alanine carboxypeptidase family protein [Bacillota bacterium]|nr:D-alanyl-D-alanine carboxypeptidase family protein [Bacillota bacterium]